MRFLIIDANYPAFLDGIYNATPNLTAATYEEQLAGIRVGMFGEAGFQVDALRSLGHEADVIITNAHHAQRAWAREHGIGHVEQSTWQFRYRRGFVPWLSRVRSLATWPIVLAQAKDYRPDVVFVAIADTIPLEVAAELRSLARLLVAQVATTLPDIVYGGYDLVLSSIPKIVDRFTAAGTDSEWVPLAFEPSVLDQVPTHERDIPVSFVGSFTDAYQDRVQIVEAVARVAQLQTWTANRGYLAPDSPVIPTIRGSAFGRDMYGLLGRSRITLNSHGTISGPHANNLRLFEATGMGALLVTDHRVNVGDLFDVGSEVITYRSPSEAAEMVRHYLENPADARRVADGGQQRTLRDHTWINRMERLVASLRSRV